MKTKTIDRYFILREKHFIGDHEVYCHAKRETEEHYICDTVEIKACNSVCLQWDRSISKKIIDEEIKKDDFLKEMDNALVFFTNVMRSVK